MATAAVCRTALQSSSQSTSTSCWPHRRVESRPARCDFNARTWRLGSPLPPVTGEGNWVIRGRARRLRLQRKRAGALETVAGGDERNATKSALAVCGTIWSIAAHAEEVYECSAVQLGYTKLCVGYKFDSTAIRRSFDCLSHVTKFTVT